MNDDIRERLERSLSAGLDIRPVTEIQVKRLIDAAIVDHERSVERKGYIIAAFGLITGCAIGFLIFC